MSNFDNEIWQRLTTLSCTGVSTSEKFDNQLFTVYPNPVLNVLSLNVNQAGTNFMGQILDINGRVLRSFVNQKTVDISGLPTGFYALKVSNTEGVILGQKTFVKN